MRCHSQKKAPPVIAEARKKRRVTELDAIPSVHAPTAPYPTARIAPRTSRGPTTPYLASSRHLPFPLAFIAPTPFLPETPDGSERDADDDRTNERLGFRAFPSFPVAAEVRTPPPPPVTPFRRVPSDSRLVRGPGEVNLAAHGCLVVPGCSA